VSRGFWHKILGLFAGFSRGNQRDFGGRGGEGRFQPLGEARQAVLRFIRAHRFLTPPILHLFLRLKVSIPGVVGVPIKVIGVHGELRERIQDVSGLL
jgi:hypothetical protein